ncbi:MAG: hypothetical protein ACRDH8_03490 [Actinomycetota bacterium]
MVVARAPSTVRRTAFRVIASLMAVAGIGFGLFTAVFAFVGEGQEIHAFHNGVVAALLIVLSGLPALAAARDPERSTKWLVHLAVVGVAGLVTMILSLTVDPFTLPVIFLVGVLWALRPSDERPLPSGRPRPVLLVLALAAAVPLGAYALGQAELQRIDTSEHADFYHWVETSFTAGSVLLLGLLVAVRPAAYRVSAWAGGVTIAVMGAASLLLQGKASAFDTQWAWAALAGSVAFVGVTEWEARRTERAGRSA